MLVWHEHSSLLGQKGIDKQSVQVKHFSGAPGLTPKNIRLD
jgi:hypothetical protein